MRTAEKQPFRITIEQYNQRVSVEVDHSDVCIEQVADLLEQVLLGAGWAKSSVKGIFNHDS